jgi:short-subunit dehydrogenase
MTDSAFFDRYGPYALVTGASSGIGRSFAELLAARGMNLVLTARRIERLQELAGELNASHGVDIQVVQADLADLSAPQQLLEATAALDIGLVVSNAGAGLKGEHAKHAPDAISAMLLLNGNAPLLLANGFIPRLRQRGRGGLLFTSSVEGLLGCPYSTAYSASKALVVALGEGLWGELTPEGIDVLTICPGATATEAAAKQGVDLTKLQNVMQPEAVAQFALDNIANGPTLVPSPHYQAMFEQLRAMQRRDALTAMARNMKNL